MGYVLSREQLTWLETTSTEERSVFLAQGPAESRQMAISKPGGFDKFHAATLRGVRVDETRWETPAEAQSCAERHLRELNASVAGLAPLNEHALGIHGDNQIVGDLCGQFHLRPSHCVHLLALAHTGVANDHSDWLIDTVARWLDGSTAPHRSVQWALPSLFSEAFRENGLDNPLEALHESIVDDHAHGLLLEVDRPVKKHFENSQTFSWGHYTSFVVYGTTYRDAIERAAHFADVLTQDEREAQGVGVEN